MSQLNSKKITGWTIGLIILVSIIFYFSWVNQAPSNSPTTKTEIFSVEKRDILDTIREIGTVDIGKMIIANTPIATKLKKIYVKQNDTVKKGQLLFTLDNTDLVTAEKESKAVLDKAKEDLDKLKKQPDSETRNQAETAYIQASTAFVNSERALKTNEELYKEGFISQVTYQQSKEDGDISKRKFDLAKQAYDKAMKPASKDAITQAETLVDKAKKDLEKVQDQLSQCEYKSPMDGKILDCYIKPMDWELHPDGIPLAQGNAIVRIGDTHRAYVRIDIFESEIRKVALGQKALVTSETLGDQQLSGEVTEIGSFAMPVGNLRKFPVTLKIDSSNAELKPGTSVEVKLIVSERKSVPSIPLRCLLDDKGKPMVKVLRDNKRDFAYVNTGLDDGDYIEITKGLSVGDRVLAEEAK